MKKTFFCLILLFVFYSSNANNYFGYFLPDSFISTTDSLKLTNGAIIYKTNVPQYLIGIYSKKFTSNQVELINSQEPIIILFSFLSDSVDLKIIKKDWLEVLKNNNIQDKILLEDFEDFFDCISEIKIINSTVIQLDYEPGSGTNIYYNDEQKCIIEGFEFKKALISIFAGDNPLNPKAKIQLMTQVPKDKAENTDKWSFWDILLIILQAFINASEN